MNFQTAYVCSASCATWTACVTRPAHATGSTNQLNVKRAADKLDAGALQEPAGLQSSLSKPQSKAFAGTALFAIGSQSMLSDSSALNVSFELSDRIA